MIHQQRPSLWLCLCQRVVMVMVLLVFALVIVVRPTDAFLPSVSQRRNPSTACPTKQALVSSSSSAHPPHHQQHYHHRTVVSLQSAPTNCPRTRPILKASSIMSSDNSETESSPFLFPSSSTLGPIASTLSKIGMMAFIIGMCLTLPIALTPAYFFHKFGWISKTRMETWSLKSGQFCARWLLRILPFCKVDCTTTGVDPTKDPEPSVWVCNHTSALDVFLLLAKDLQLRGRKKRPIKIVYWKQLEDNPITKLLFQQCGFIPVQMSANKAGEDNEYDIASFKQLLKAAKTAFAEGFDIGILPEGQLNPTPEQGLLPCFPGAYTLARLSRRPIQFMALQGAHHLWHPKEEIGMKVTGRHVKARIYPNGRKYASSDEFLDTFQAVVGEFGTKGYDLPQDELNGWLDGSLWKTKQEELKQQQQKEEKGQREVTTPIETVVEPKITLETKTTAQTTSA